MRLDSLSHLDQHCAYQNQTQSVHSKQCGSFYGLLASPEFELVKLQIDRKLNATSGFDRYVDGSGRVEKLPEPLDNNRRRLKYHALIPIPEVRKRKCST
jgi:hypothetical protein